MSSRTVSAAVIAVVATAGLSACSDDPSGRTEDPPQKQSVSPGQGTSAPTVAPAVQPAQGTEFKLPTISMRLTEGRWLTHQLGNTWGATQRRKLSVIDVHLSNILAVTDNLDIDAEARLEVKDEPWLARTENRVIDGAEAWVLDGRNDKVHTYMVGGFTGDRMFAIEFDVPVTWADGDQLIEQMLASVQITDPVG